MDNQLILLISVAATVALLTWWAIAMLCKDGGGKLRDRLRTDEEENSAPAGKRDIGKLFQRVGSAAAKPFMPKTREKQSAVRRRLGYAGIYTAGAVKTMTGFKVLLLGGGLLGGYAVGTAFEMPLLGVSLGGLVGYLLPTLWLKIKISAHQQGLDRGLPDSLDLLVVCVEAGLTVDAAMQRVGQELHLAHPRVSREFEIAHMETRVGVARSEALRNMGQRTGNKALQALATMLTQAERFGTSIASALRIHADTLRVNRQHAAEETAAKASVKLSFPVVLFIFPAVLIVLAGPAVIGLFNSGEF